MERLFKDSFKTHFFWLLKMASLVSPFWSIYPCNLHYLYAYLHGFRESSARILISKEDSIGIVIKHSTVIRNGGEIWSKNVCAWTDIQVKEYVTTCSLIIINWVIALCFIYVLVCLTCTSRTILNVLFYIPVIGERALKINGILQI